MSRSTRSSSGRSRTAFPTERGGPAGFEVWPSPSMVCHGPPRRFVPVRPRPAPRPSSFSPPLRVSGFVRRAWGWGECEAEGALTAVGARRLRVLALALDGLPRPAPSIRPGAAAPGPAALLLLPALADQRLREAVVVLGKVVAEATLHAGRALIGSVELDVRRGDAHDLVAGHVQVHLAADAAVRADRADRLVRVEHLLGREPLARHHLENRAGRADPHTLAAPGAPRLVRVAVRPDDDLGVLASLAHVEHADHLDVLTRAHAARAQDARTHVVPDHRIAGPLVAVAQDEVALPERRGNDPIAHDVILELVAGPRPLPVAVAQVLARVALEQQPEHAFAVFNRRVGLALHHHPLRRLGGAGREQFRLPLHRHQADTAIPDYRQLGIPAQRDRKSVV